MPAEYQPVAHDELSWARTIFIIWDKFKSSGSFEEHYVGHYRDRAEFGHELLLRLGVDVGLPQVPPHWRGYLEWKTDALVTDFEEAGHFYIEQPPYHDGIFVFETNPGVVIDRQPLRSRLD